MSTTPPPQDPGQEPPPHDPGQEPPPQDAKPSQPPEPGEAATPAAPPPSSAERDTDRHAGIGSRLGARIIDGLIVGIAMAIILVVLPGVSAFGGIGSAIIAVVTFAYFVYLEGTSGQTLAKRMLGLRVERADGATMDFEAAGRRNWWQLLGVLSLIPVIGAVAGLASLGIVIWIAVTISNDPANRGVHDGWGGTRVVRTG